MNPVQRVDGVLGRLLMRGVAIVAFLVATAAGAFGSIVLWKGYLIGVVILSCGALFAWLGRLAWRDRAGLGEILNRDFAPTRNSKSD
jgi:hypothetical protein